MVGLFVVTWLIYAPSAQEENDRKHRVRQENAEQLARAEIKVPCANGDIAFITRERSERTDGERMMLHVAPRAGTTRNELLAIADGQFRTPPRAGGVAAWVARTGECWRSAKARPRFIWKKTSKLRSLT